MQPSRAPNGGQVMLRDTRHGNTGKEMVASGAWVKVGKKHYRHASGQEITYDNNRWAWRAMGNLWSALWVAQHEVERANPW
jgi:hypothetical protein